MKELLILGAGTAGTMMANHLSRNLPDNWNIKIIDQEETHYYQPGYLFIPFGIYQPEDVVKKIDKYIPERAKWVRETIDRIDKDGNLIYLQNGEQLSYDLLIVATGTDINPDEVEGMNDVGWQKDIFDFYTFEGSKNLGEKLKNWSGGKLVVHICELPIKCPVAPLEFAFLADSFFKDNGIRENVEITFVTPVDGAFTKPKASAALNHLLEEKNIKVVPNFNIERVDNENKKIIDYGGTEVAYDLLVTVPTNMGAKAIERSGFGDELNFIPTHKGTLQSKVKDNIFVIGDATDVPASKAGSVAHFEAEILTKNILNYINGNKLEEEFDGHANCFVETGNGKAILIDFNYTHEPVTGTFPFPGIGPLSLLKETYMNHMSKMAFKWVYWNMLLPGRHIPFIPNKMSEKGKDF